MILRTGILVMLFILSLSGCSTTKSVIWKAQDVSFSYFNSFEILPVFNATGSSFNNEIEILSSLTAHIKEQFEEQNLHLTDNPQSKSRILTVHSELLIYEATRVISGVNRKARCKLRTRLIEKLNNDVVAEILTVREVRVQIIESKAYEWILKKTAAEVAKEVAGIMQPITPEGISQDI